MLFAKIQNTILSFTFGFAFATLLYSNVIINNPQTIPGSQHLNNEPLYLQKKGPLGVTEEIKFVSGKKEPSEVTKETHHESSSLDALNDNRIPTDVNKYDNKAQPSNADTNSVKEAPLPSDMCSSLDLHSSSAASIWTKHLKDIFYASRHDQDQEAEFIWHDFTAILLNNYIKPQRLQSSIKTLPSKYWKQVGDILEVAWGRYKFVSQRKNGKKGRKVPKGEEPRKLNILVMGGSVTMGVFSQQNPVMETSRFTRRNCAWPTRLGQLLNHLFGDDIVDVHMITLGGTNTNSAIQIWDYALFPSDMPHPDIVIHGYSTNDMHVLSENEAEKRGITLEDMILEVNQNFVRTILKPQTTCNSRPVPLLLYYDDYVGNEQRQILKTNSFGRAAQTLANYYGFGLISYADAVRDLIYGDTDEDWFSPSKWPERQVHPGMGMHISSMWFVAFNLLNIATTYCSSIDLLTDTESNKYIPRNGLPDLRKKEELKGEPKRFPSNLPPELNANTSLDDISFKWEENHLSLFNASSCKASEHPLIESCAYSWIGGLERKFDKPKHLETRMASVLVLNNGWEASNDNNKLGFQAKEKGGSFEMKFEVRNLEIQTINFMVMTSYGEKWEGSKIRVDVFVDRFGKDESDKPIKTQEISGFHDRQTSETYDYKLDLEGERAVATDTLRVRVELVSGTTFKFMGMAICDH